MRPMHKLLAAAQLPVVTAVTFAARRLGQPSVLGELLMGSSLAR